MQKSRLIALFTFFLIFLTVGHFAWQVYSYRADIFTHFDSGYWTTRYKESQWVVPNSKNSIGDDGLYMYAGYRYIQGDDPSLLNAEAPPFGKYLIGFFETTTGIMGAFSVFFGGLALILFYLFNKTVVKSTLLSLIPVALFSFEPIFTSQLRAAYLDTLYLSCLLLGFTLVLRKKYLFAGLAFGAFMAVKSPFPIAFVYATVFLYLFLQKQLSIKRVCMLIIPTGAFYIFTYTATFLHGHDILYFLKVQKYIVHFYATGTKGVLGAVFPMLVTGNWYTWFGGVERVPEWLVTWPLISLGAIVSFLVWVKHKSSAILFQLIWVGFYMLFLIVTPLFARYLLLLLPFLYNLSIWSLSAVIKSKSS